MEAHLSVAEETMKTDRWLSAARLGDSMALGHLLEQYRHYLGLLARLQITGRLQGKVDPADLVQDTFLEAHRHFSAFQGNTEVELVGWLRTILAGLLANLVRRYFGTQRRDARLEMELANQVADSSRAMDRGLVAPNSTPSQGAMRREHAVLLANALERLPRDYREVLILHHLEGLPFPEVAQRMGRSLDSVKNLWARGLSQLRRTMKEME